MFAYTVTNQVVNAFLELGLPIILRKVAEYRGKNPNGSSKSPKNVTPTAPAKASASVQLGRVIGPEGEKNVLPSAEDDTKSVSDDERKLLDKIEAEAALPAYDLFSQSTLRGLVRFCSGIFDSHSSSFVSYSGLRRDGDPIRARCPLGSLLAARGL